MWTEEEALTYFLWAKNIPGSTISSSNGEDEGEEVSEEEDRMEKTEVYIVG